MAERYPRYSYIKDTYGSAARFELVANAIDFPRDLRGKVMVDIGSSASVAVKRLNERGARAYGVDFQYTSLESLVRSIEPSFTDEDRWNFPVARHIEPNLRGEKGELPKPSINPVIRLLGWFGEYTRDYRIWAEAATYLRRSEKVYKEFLQDFNAVPKVGQYIAARGESLPFQDGSVDLVYSVTTLSVFVIRDRSAFMRSMQEALRVAKSGGQIQLNPWFEQSNSVWSPKEFVNANHLLGFLKVNNIPYMIEDDRKRESGGSLRIIKP